MNDRGGPVPFHSGDGVERCLQFRNRIAGDHRGRRLQKVIGGDRRQRPQRTGPHLRVGIVEERCHHGRQFGGVGLPQGFDERDAFGGIGGPVHRRVGDQLARARHAKAGGRQQNVGAERASRSTQRGETGADLDRGDTGIAGPRRPRRTEHPVANRLLGPVAEAVDGELPKGWRQRRS